MTDTDIPDLSTEFTGRVALVTGGGSGIGRAIAKRWARAGGTVAVLGRRQDALDETVRHIIEAGGQAEAVVGDVRDHAGVAAAVDDLVIRHGRIDALINNAAGNFVVPAEDLSPGGWKAVTDIVLNGTYYCTHAVAMTRTLAVEWGDCGVRVNCLAPGPTETEGAGAALWGNPEARRDVLASVPAGRFAPVTSPVRCWSPTAGSGSVNRSTPPHV
jgi:NAD(P)-dependent dehydrogenase (short-subunit alcohol dehydrogenase family)